MSNGFRNFRTGLCFLLLFVGLPWLVTSAGIWIFGDVFLLGLMFLGIAVLLVCAATMLGESINNERPL